jgi:hypothetical protein
MKLPTLITALTLGAADVVSGHYIFQQFGVASKKFAVYEHIRKNSNYNSPVTSLSSNDLRCNVGGGSGAGTTVLNVVAGESFTFYSDTAVYHQGPISLYVCPVPGEVQWLYDEGMVMLMRVVWQVHVQGARLGQGL